MCLTDKKQNSAGKDHLKVPPTSATLKPKVSFSSTTSNDDKCLDEDIYYIIEEDTTPDIQYEEDLPPPPINHTHVSMNTIDEDIDSSDDVKNGNSNTTKNHD